MTVDAPEENRQTLIELLPRQKEAYRILLEAEPGSYTLLGYGGSMGGGKTAFLARVAIDLCLAYPGTRILVARNELTTLKTTTMEEFYKQLPAVLLAKRHDTENWCDVRKPEWPKGIASRVFFRGLENYQKKGSEAYQAVLIDEASEVESTAAEYMLTRLRWRLPKVVADLQAKQCRALVPLPNGDVGACGLVCPSGTCSKHGAEKVGNGVKYFFLCSSNPWPGFFADWFWHRKLDVALAAIPQAKVHFVPALPRDNPYNGEHYEAMLRGTLSPDMAARMVDGRFDVYSGLIYEGFIPAPMPTGHMWIGPNPKDTKDYVRVIGGLDFGQESSTAHYSAGIVSVITKTGRLIRVDEFKERGPDIAERQMRWMAAMDDKWAKPIGKRIQWRADKTQMVGIQMWRKMFHVTPSKGGPDSVDQGILKVAQLFNKDANGIPGSFYLPHLTKWEAEMREYRRDPDTLKVIKKNDDVIDSDRYMHELFGVAMGDPNKLFKNALAVVS